jgi:tetratricopeptide (TPR) repeat protein
MNFASRIGKKEVRSQKSGVRMRRRANAQAYVAAIGCLVLATVAFGQSKSAPAPAKQTPAKSRDLYVETNSATTPTSIPRGYALIIGIADYKNLPAKSQLEFSERDAESIYSILINPEGGSFRAENVHRLIGAKATLANIKQELEVWLPSVAKPDDRVVIYFAGHGFVQGGRAYLAPYDLDPSNIAGTGYPMETLGDVVGSRINARWKVLLTDSCHSGAIDPSAAAQYNKSLLDLSRSMFSLTASRDRERSFESKDWGGGHGIFTYYVVKGLEGQADENGDGLVTADELADYTRTNVREATNGQQNPTSDRGSFDPNMYLSVIPAALRSAKAPVPKDGTLVFETNQDGVEVFVDGVSQGVINRAKPLTLEGMKPGNHTVQGVKNGYEPDGPREEMVYPGRASTVSIKILVVRRRSKAALDELNDGVKEYSKGSGGADYKKAAAHFEKALQIDPTYSEAALYLGRVYNALFDEAKSEAAYRKAIEIDPDYMEARVGLAGMLLDIGGVDESIRQLNIVTQRDKSNATALYLQAQAYRMKELYPQAIDSARAAIKLAPTAAEPHMWLADSLRLSGKYADAATEYIDYLRLSDFDSKLGGKMNYYVLGYLTGFGRKKRAGQTDTWHDMRSLAYFGLCDAERKQDQYESAIEYCRRSLAYDNSDPYTHYALALCYAHMAQATGSLETLSAAAKHFQAMLDINGDIEEARYARTNLKNIDAVLAAR